MNELYQWRDVAEEAARESLKTRRRRSTQETQLAQVERKLGQLMLENEALKKRKTNAIRESVGGGGTAPGCWDEDRAGVFLRGGEPSGVLPLPISDDTTAAGGARKDTSSTGGG